MATDIENNDLRSLIKPKTEPVSNNQQGGLRSLIKPKTETQSPAQPQTPPTQNVSDTYKQYKEQNPDIYMGGGKKPIIDITNPEIQNKLQGYVQEQKSQLDAIKQQYGIQPTTLQPPQLPTDQQDRLTQPDLTPPAQTQPENAQIKAPDEKEEGTTKIAKETLQEPSKQSRISSALSAAEKGSVELGGNILRAFGDIIGKMTDTPANETVASQIGQGYIDASKKWFPENPKYQGDMLSTIAGFVPYVALFGTGKAVAMGTEAIFGTELPELATQIPGAVGLGLNDMS